MDSSVAEEMHRLKVAPATGRIETSGALSRIYQETFPQGSKTQDQFIGTVQFLFNNCGRQFMDMRSAYLFFKFRVQTGAAPAGANPELFLGFNPVADCFAQASAYINETLVSRCDFVGQTSAISQRLYYSEAGRLTTGTVEGLQAETLIPASSTEEYQFGIPLGSFLGVYNSERFLPPGLNHRLELVVSSQYKQAIVHSQNAGWAPVGGNIGAAINQGEYRVSVDQIFLQLCRVEQKDQINFADMSLAPYEYDEVNITLQGQSTSSSGQSLLTVLPSTHTLLIGFQGSGAGSSVTQQVWHFDDGGYVPGTSDPFAGANNMNELNRLQVLYKGIEASQQYNNVAQIARTFYEFLWNSDGMDRAGLESLDTYRRLGILAAYDYRFAASNRDTQVNIQFNFNAPATNPYNLILYYKARRLLNLRYDQSGQLQSVNVQDM